MTSLEKIYKTSAYKIIEYIKDFDLDTANENAETKYEYKECLFLNFKKEYTLDAKEIIPYWFHNTRVEHGTNFTEGIYPLDQALSLIDKKIDKIVYSLGLEINQIDSRLCDNVKTKLNSNGNSGPWGYLIKEICFFKIDSEHNYLDIPEVVEDIVTFKYRKFYDIIIQKYKDITAPCIVKFSTGQILHPDNLEYVINYLFQKFHHIMYNNQSVFSFCNSGRLINSKMIEEIDYVSNEKLHF